MKFYLAFIFAFISHLVYGQTPYENHFGSTEADTGFSISPGSDGNGSMTVGVTYGYGAQGADILLLRQDNSGDKIWSKTVGSAEDEAAKAVITASDGSYVLTGYRTTAGKGKDLLIIKFDNDGTIIWQRQLGATNDDEALSITERVYDPGTGFDTTYLVTGYVTNISNNKDFFYLELNTDGSTRLFTNYGSTGDDIGTGITTVPGIYDPIIGGYSNGYGAGDNDIVVLYLGNSGIVSNVRRYTQPGEDKAYDIMVDPTGSSASFKISIVGSTNSFSANGDLDAFLMFTLNQSQSNGLCKIYGNEFDDEAYSVQAQGADGFTFTGYHTDALSGNKEGMQIFTDHGANNEGSRGTYACTGDEIIYDLVNTNDTLYTTGISSSFTNGASDIFSNGFIGLFAGVQSFCNHQSFSPPQNDEFFLPRNEFANTNPSDFSSATEEVLPVLSETIITDIVGSACSEDLGTSCDISLGPDTTSCSSSIELVLDLPICTTIEWSTGETNDTITVTESGTYSFTTSGACQVTDTIVIKLPQGTHATYDDWHFGNKARIDFSSGIAMSGVGLTNATRNYSTLTVEGETYVASTSEILNSSNATITNGDAFDISNVAAQPALFLAPKDNPTFAFLYTINSSGTLTFSTINVTPPAQVFTKESVLVANTTGKLAAFQTEDTSWVAVKTTSGLKTYFVTAGGTLTEKDVATVPADNISSTGILKFSPRGNKLCLAYSSSNQLILFDFDKQTGELSNQVTITGVAGSPQGVEFSPGENKLYITSPGASRIYQFDLLADVISNSKTEIQTLAGDYEYLELGPDGKIYISQSSPTAGTMSIIENPNADPTDLIFLKNGFSLGLGLGNASLINYPRYIVNENDLSISITNLCSGASTNASINESFTGSTRWDFGDITTTADTSLLASPNYIYPSAGDYTVTLTNEKDCNVSNTFYQKVTLTEGPQFDILDTTDCSNETITLSLPISADSMRWANNETTSPQNFTASGTESLTAWSDGCAFTDTFRISLGTSTVLTTFETGQQSKRANIWYFGEKAGLDFNTSPPTVLTDGQTDQIEGTSVISDEEGKLQFYTDGITVWNKSHNVMENGTGLKGSWTSTHSCLIVPHPGDAYLYYVFTVPGNEDNRPSTGCRYSIVDLSLNNGNGAVTTKNQLLFTPSSEKIVAVLHANQTSYWVIGHGYPGNTFYTYKIDKNGLNTTAIETDIGTPHDGAVDYIGQMKISPNGRWLATTIGQSGVELFDFNSSTGVISNSLFIGSVGQRNYGLEFSPNSSKLYASNYFGLNIDQWTLSDSIPASIINSQTTIYNAPSSTPFKAKLLGMQLAPDGKIYVSQEDGRSNLDVIENPDADANDLNYVVGGLSLGSGIVRNSMPNYISSYFAPSKSIIGRDCSDEGTELFIDASADVISWDFGDPSSGADNMAGATTSVTHNFSTSGEYTVEVTYNDACLGETSITTTLDIQYITVDTSFIDTAVCAESLILNAENSTADFTWTNQPSGSTIGTGQTQNISISGDYQVIITNGSCTKTIDYNVLLGPAINLDNLPDSSFICIEKNEELTLDPLLDININNYSWSVNSNDNQPLVVFDTGSYTIIASFDTLCEASKTVHVINSCEPIVLVPKAFTPNNDLLNDELEVFAFNVLSIEFIILNEWGEVVFKSNDFTTFWDGTYLGEESATSTYAWIAKYKGLVEGVEQEFEKIGEVTLIR